MLRTERHYVNALYCCKCWKKKRRVGVTRSGVERGGGAMVAAKLGFYLKNRKGKSISRSREGYNRALGERKIGIYLC